MPYELPPDPSTERRTRLTRWVELRIRGVLVGAGGLFRVRRLRGLAPAHRPSQPHHRLPHAGDHGLGVRGHQLRHRDRCRAGNRGRSDGLRPTGRTGRGRRHRRRHRSGRLVHPGRQRGRADGPDDRHRSRLGKQQEQHARPRAPSSTTTTTCSSSTSAITGRAPLHPPRRACARPSDLRAMIDWLEATKAPDTDRGHGSLDGRCNRPRRGGPRRAGRGDHHRVDPRLAGERRPGAAGAVSGYPLPCPAAGRSCSAH